MHIILDLDQTLINTESNILPYSTNDVPNVVHLQQTNLNIYNPDSMKYFTIGKQTYVYTRPHLKSFLEYLYNNHKVSIWTAGQLDYCLNIIKRILSDNQFKKTRYIIARDNYNFKCVTGMYAFQYGFKPDPENIIIPFVFDKEKNLIKKLDIKTIQIDPIKFYKIFYKSNSNILIDDNPKIYNENNKFDINKKKHTCVYNIKGFYPAIDTIVNSNSFKDDELKKCISILEKHKNLNNKKKYKTIKVNLKRNARSKKIRGYLRNKRKENQKKLKLFKKKYGNTQN